MLDFLALFDAGELAEVPPTPTRTVEVFSSAGCGRGLRVCTAVTPGHLLLLDRAALPDSSCANLAEFAATTTSAWPYMSECERARLLELHWRAAQPVSAASLSEATPCFVEEWALAETRNALCTPSSSSSAPPSSSRLRGLAALNSMAVGRLVLKPSLLKTWEAEAKHGLAVYPIGSLVNHSCAPTATRLPLSRCLVVRAARHLLAREELTYTYIEVRAPVEVRQASLEKTWGFECSCDRCILEMGLWKAAGRETQRAAQLVWRRFERLRTEGRCSETELESIVSEADALTEEALHAFLDSCRENSEIVANAVKTALWQSYRRAADLCPVERRKGLRAKLEPMARKERGRQEQQGEGQEEASVQEMLALRDLVLSSYWLSPAWELAFGWQEGGSRSRAAALWARVASVSAEVLPLSTSHVAASMEAALAAAETALAGDGDVASGCCSAALTSDGVLPGEFCRLLRESVRVSDGLYGGGVRTWRRLAAARLEVMGGQLAYSITSALAMMDTSIPDNRPEVRPEVQALDLDLSGMD